jgi:hypothetical protein
MKLAGFHSHIERGLLEVLLAVAGPLEQVYMSRRAVPEE